MNNKTLVIKNILTRMNTVIFITIVVGLLIFCILVLDNVFDHPDGNSSIKTAPTTIVLDQTTKSQLDQLKNSDNNIIQTLPVGRINPFAE